MRFGNVTQLISIDMVIAICIVNIKCALCLQQVTFSNNIPQRSVRYVFDGSLTANQMRIKLRVITMTAEAEHL